MVYTKRKKKHGAANFEIDVLDEAKTKGELEEKEQYYICKLGTLAPGGYNLSKGGTIPAFPGRELEVKSLGLKFPSIAEAAKHFEVSPGLVVSRLSQGYTPEQSLGIEALNWCSSGWHSVQIDGKKFKHLKQAAEHFGHPPNRVRNRLNKGWSIEKALKTPFADRATPVTIRGVEYRSLREASRKLGFPKDRIASRLRAGKDPLEN